MIGTKKGYQRRTTRKKKRKNAKSGEEEEDQKYSRLGGRKAKRETSHQLKA